MHVLRESVYLEINIQVSSGHLFRRRINKPREEHMLYLARYLLLLCWIAIRYDELSPFNSRGQHSKPDSPVVLYPDLITRWLDTSGNSLSVWWNC